MSDLHNPFVTTDQRQQTQTPLSSANPFASQGQQQQQLSSNPFNPFNVSTATTPTPNPFANQASYPVQPLQPILPNNQIQSQFQPRNTVTPTLHDPFTSLSYQLSPALPPPQPSAPALPPRRAPHHRSPSQASDLPPAYSSPTSSPPRSISPAPPPAFNQPQNLTSSTSTSHNDLSTSSSDLLRQQQQQSHIKQLEEDELLARRLVQQESAALRRTSRDTTTAAAGPTDVPPRRTSLPTHTRSQSQDRHRGVSSDPANDAELARILQEEEDAAFAEEIASQEGSGYGGGGGGGGIGGRSEARRGSGYYYGAPSQQQPPPPPARVVTRRNTDTGGNGGFFSVTGTPSRMAFRRASMRESPVPSFGAPVRSPGGAVGKPGHYSPFEVEANRASRFLGGEYRDLDVCFWGGECVTVLEGADVLYYVNLVGCVVAGGRDGVWEVVLQRNSAEGDNVYQMRETFKGKVFQVYDPVSGKAVNCARGGKNGAQLAFTTLTGLEKLLWVEGEMRVMPEAPKGLFGKLTRRESATRVLGQDGGDLDLCGYIVREEGDRDFELRRFRIRVGGRGLGRLDLVVASFIGNVLLGSS
ncbi:hypothetical protein HDU79_002196 [Rhizoclosmatium sp. JEL0117]|nr:hypothetical protein HDU79_002196 [Rhizoclosmatium sp. JEL0117]